jgi:hypothetical protein
LFAIFNACLECLPVLFVYMISDKLVDKDLIDVFELIVEVAVFEVGFFIYVFFDEDLSELLHTVHNNPFTADFVKSERMLDKCNILDECEHDHERPRSCIIELLSPLVWILFVIGTSLDFILIQGSNMFDSIKLLFLLKEEQVLVISMNFYSLVFFQSYLQLFYCLIAVKGYSS